MIAAGCLVWDVCIDAETSFPLLVVFVIGMIVLFAVSRRRR